MQPAANTEGIATKAARRGARPAAVIGLFLLLALGCACLRYCSMDSYTEAIEVGNGDIAFKTASASRRSGIQCVYNEGRSLYSSNVSHLAQAHATVGLTFSLHDYQQWHSISIQPVITRKTSA